MYVTSASSLGGIAAKVPEMMTTVVTYMERNNLPKNGAPFILYNSIDETNSTAIFSAAVATRDKVVTPNTSSVLCGSLPRQKVVKTTLNGNYKNLEEAWKKTETYILKNKLEKNTSGMPMEVFVVSSENTANPANWVTELYIPIQ